MIALVGNDCSDDTEEIDVDLGASPLVTGSTTGFHEDIAQFFYLPLATDVRTKTTLGQLASTLVLVVLQQFHDALLIGGKTNHLTNETTDETNTLTKGLQREQQMSPWPHRMARKTPSDPHMGQKGWMKCVHGDMDQEGHLPLCDRRASALEHDVS